jgi:hypothetical protein
MRVPGKRIKRTRLVRTDRFVVAVEVEAVVPHVDPSEVCYESEIVELLREVEKHAMAGDLVWLKQHGKVYAAVEAAGSFRGRIPSNRIPSHGSDSQNTL